MLSAAAALLLVVISSGGAVGDPRWGGSFGNRGGSAEPRLFAPFNANISANIQNGKNALGSPQNSLTFLINVVIAYVTVQFMWFTAHFLFWDYSQTLPPEEFSKEGVIQFLASKDTAVYNQLAIWGTAATSSLIFLIPPVVLNTFNLVPATPTAAGKKRKKRRRRGASEEHINDYEYYYYDDDGDVASERNFPTFTQGGSFADVPQNIQDSLRRLLCPLCVARRFAFNTLSVISAFIFWNLTPYTLAVNSASAGQGGLVGRKKGRL